MTIARKGAFDPEASRTPPVTPRALLGNVLAPQPLGRAAVVFGEGRILDVVRDPRILDLPPDVREVEGFICPGFVELQINGSFGLNVGPDGEALKHLARELPKTGTTSFLPTLVSSPEHTYPRFLDALSGVRDVPGARILGAHLEGPFLSPLRKGAHDPANLLPIDLGLIRTLAGSGLVSMMTLAPELPRAREAIRLLLENGVVPSAGHTDATYEELTKAVDAGLGTGTHLYNAMSPLGHRAPGAVGALLSDHRTRVGIIADGVHVHEAALEIAYLQKGPDALALVTDAMEAAGMPEGEYELGDRKVRLEGNAVRTPEGSLAGSVLTMDAALRNAAGFLNIPLHEALRMNTSTPAAVLGLPARGKIAPGADADLVVLSAEGEVLETLVAGRRVYGPPEEPA
jgi:N-acetylglucosamine-6-phosphate deacetylase